MFTLKTIVSHYISRRAISVMTALVMALAISSVLIYLSGFNPLIVYSQLLSGGFGSPGRIALTLNKTAPILFAGLGLVLAFRCGVWNIGSEGQLYMGAVGATLAGLLITDIPTVLHLTLVAIASFIFGGIWGAIPGILKVKYQASEIITSLLMVFIAQLFVTYLTRFPMRAPLDVAVGYPVSERIASTAWLPKFLPPTTLHAGIIIALGLAIVIWFVLQKSSFGYRIKAIGVSPATALYGGVPVGKVIITTMFLSGGMAGLAGMSQVSGIFHLLHDQLSSGYGFLAILVTFIGGIHPVGVVLVAVLLGGLISGSYFAQSSIGIDPVVVHVLVAIIMFSLILLPFMEKRLLPDSKHA